MVDIAKYILELDGELADEDLIFIDKETLRIEQRRADIVAKVRDEYILHLEIQNDNQSEMPLRMLRYYTEIRLNTKLPVRQYLIYTGKDRCTMPDFVEENLSSPDGWRYRYRLIDMRTIDCEQFLILDSPDAVVLAILCNFKKRSEREVMVAILAKLNALTGANPQLLGKYLAMLEELAENRGLQQLMKEVETMLSDMSLEKLPSFELGMEKGMANVRALEQAARKEGKTEGFLEGEEKGEQKNKRAIAKVMLAKGFEPALIHEITSLSLEEIRQLARETE